MDKYDKLPNSKKDRIKGQKYTFKNRIVIWSGKRWTMQIRHPLPKVNRTYFMCGFKI